MTPETIAAIEGLLASARVQAQADAVLHRKGWAHQYAQDVGDLLAEVGRLRTMQQVEVSSSAGFRGWWRRREPVVAVRVPWQADPIVVMP